MLAAATLLVGCGSSASRPAEQAAPTVPEQWLAARASAQRQGVENLAAFYDPDLVLDHRALGSEPITGRTAALEYLNGQWQPFHDSRTQTGPVYLSTDAALTTETVTPGGQSRQIDAAVHTTMGPSGADSETIAASLVSWRTQNPAGDERTATLQALAQDYVKAWAMENADSVRALYQPDAAVTDSLAGLTARGAAQIADLADAPAPDGGLGEAVIDRLPDYRGLAIYAAGSPTQDVPFETIAVLMTLGAEDSCPRQIATVLHLSPDGLIQAEGRFHRIDDLQRCQGALPPGWWDSTVVPEPVRVERTGTLLISGMEIGVDNGTPGLEGLILWSFDQFRTHGLGTPTVRRVTFYDNQIDKCERVAGLILDDAVTLCFGTTGACLASDCTTWETWAKKAVLHELAHAWIDEHLTAEEIKRFQAATAMPTWSDPEHAWGDRGVELAAETIAWAMLDQPIPINPKLGTHTGTELAQYYEILTGRPPKPTPPG